MSEILNLQTLPIAEPDHADPGQSTLSAECFTPLGGD